MLKGVVPSFFFGMVPIGISVNSLFNQSPAVCRFILVFGNIIFKIFWAQFADTEFARLVANVKLVTVDNKIGAEFKDSIFQNGIGTDISHITH